MLNPFQYVERLMKFQHRYAPVVPLHILRVAHGWISAEWLCDHHLYDMIVYEDEDRFEISKREIKTKNDYLPSLKGYIETIKSFKWSCKMFDEIEFTGKGYSKEIPCEKLKIQTIKDQCFI